MDLNYPQDGWKEGEGSGEEEGWWGEGHDERRKEKARVSSRTNRFQSCLQKSIPAQIRQLILYISKSKGYVDGSVGKLTSAKRLFKHFV